MQADFALIEFNNERPTISDIVEIWDDEAGIRTLAKDSKGIIHTMFCVDILRTVIPPKWNISERCAPFRACQQRRT